MTDTPRLLTPYWWHGSTLLMLPIVPAVFVGGFHHVLNPGKLDADLGPGTGNPLEDTVTLFSYLADSGNW